MPWALFVLLIANIALGGYLALDDAEPRGARLDVRGLEVNADKVKVASAADADGAAPAGGEPAAKPAAAACLEWGSFGGAELERARTELDALGAARTIVRELGPAPAWWVHVPPLRTREEAEWLARQIEAAGVQDVQIVADGERWRNAISLGIFRSEEAASAHSERMKAAGVRNAAVAERNDLLRLASIFIVAPPPALVARTADLRSAFPGTELRAVACPE